MAARAISAVGVRFSRPAVDAAAADRGAGSVDDVQHAASEAGIVGFVRLRRRARRPLAAAPPAGPAAPPEPEGPDRAVPCKVGSDRARRFRSRTQYTQPSASTTAARTPAPAVSSGLSGQLSTACCQLATMVFVGELGAGQRGGGGERSGRLGGGQGGGGSGGGGRCGR